MIRILVPISKLPTIEVLGARIEVIKSSSYAKSDNWNIDLFLYVYPHTSEHIVIPCHRCELTVKMDTNVLDFNGIYLEPRIAPDNRLPSLTIACTKTEALIKGSGTLKVRTSKTIPEFKQFPNSIELIAKLTPAGVDKSVVISEKLEKANQKRQDVIAKWTFGRQDFQ